MPVFSLALMRLDSLLKTTAKKILLEFYLQLKICISELSPVLRVLNTWIKSHENTKNLHCCLQQRAANAEQTIREIYFRLLEIRQGVLLFLLGHLKRKREISWRTLFPVRKKILIDSISKMEVFAVNYFSLSQRSIKLSSKPFHQRSKPLKFTQKITCNGHWEFCFLSKRSFSRHHSNLPFGAQLATRLLNQKILSIYQWKSLILSLESRANLQKKISGVYFCVFVNSHFSYLQTLRSLIRTFLTTKKTSWSKNVYRA